MKRPGLTLIELLIVVIIVGVLALISIPNFSGARSAALHAHAQNSMAHIAHAAKIWNAEQGTAAAPFPTVNDGTFEANLGTGVTGIDLTGIDSDPIWDYNLNGATSNITATFNGTASNACTDGKSFTYNLVTNVFSTFTCK